MDLKIADRSAIVCASSRGLGKAVALKLAEEGCKVTICARNEESLVEAAKSITDQTGSLVHPVIADLGKRSDIERVVREAINTFGKVDILVTNCGGPPRATFHEIATDQWDQAYNNVLKSTIEMISEAFPHMRASHWGRIVNIASVTAKQPIPELFLSNVLRPAVVALGRSLATEFARHKVLVNNVCPGIFHTDRVQDLIQKKSEAEGTTYEEAYQSYASEIPLKRIGHPEELANFIVFLCSERASYITGTTTLVDGGLFRGV
jgi:3-oxoacyl-[acyl-carrier protein] reductase